METVELMAMFWTLAGIFPGEGEISRFDFSKRVEAAAKAGFKGIGLWHTDLEHILQTYSLKDMKQILDDNGICHIELEFLTDWFLKGGRRSESDSRRRFLLRASEALQAKHIKVGDFYNCEVPFDEIVEGFAGLCKDASDYGATIGFELMGCAMIHDLPVATRMVQQAGAANGGIIVDIYQVENLGISFDDIRRIPLQGLVNVEINDGWRPGNINHDPANRLWCGAGEYDIQGLIDCVKSMGYRGTWGVEVISQDYCKLPLKSLCDTAFQTSRVQFDALDMTSV